MDKQTIAHALEKEIKLINDSLSRLQYVNNLSIDDHQARQVSIIMKQLMDHKTKLENIVANIVADAKLFNSNFNI